MPHPRRRALFLVLASVLNELEAQGERLVLSNYHRGSPAIDGVGELRVQWDPERGQWVARDENGDI